MTTTVNIINHCHFSSDHFISLELCFPYLALLTEDDDDEEDDEGNEDDEDEEPEPKKQKTQSRLTCYYYLRIICYHQGPIITRLMLLFIDLHNSDCLLKL